MAYDVDKALLPFWEGDEMWNESFMDIKDGKEREIPLLYSADIIESVQSATLETIYEEGKDYFLRNGKLVLTADSRVPGFTLEEFYPSERILGKNFGHRDGGLIVFSEGTFIHEHQTVVTYKHKDTWDGPIPDAKLNHLPKLASRLEKGEAVDVLIYGDSISCGWNSSEKTGIAPFAPTWMQMTMDGLRKAWPSSAITWTNASEGGRDAAWALGKCPERLAGLKPDLAIIAFGMNDGSGEVSGENFADSTKGIMEYIRGLNPDVEFVLIITTTPNPETMVDFGRMESLSTGKPLDELIKEHGWTKTEKPFYGTQDEYPAVMNAMETTGVITADMYSMQKALLSHKRFSDMSGNNVNHPNDFLARMYAQVLLATLS